MKAIKQYFQVALFVFLQFCKLKLLILALLEVKGLTLMLNLKKWEARSEGGNPGPSFALYPPTVISFDLMKVK